MTLNQVLRRIESLALGHNQVRTFRKGLVGDLFADKQAKYAAVCLQDLGGVISLGGHATTLNYRMVVADLVHVSADAKTNEEDVISDTASIIMDLLAQMNNNNYDDWKISADNNLQFFVESENDLHAGCSVDFSVRIMYEQNICQVPTDISEYIPTDNEMKLVNDTTYIATGSEGTLLNVPGIAGNNVDVLLIIREGATLYKVSNMPGSSEYAIADGTIIELGTPTLPNQRFLILYRNY